MVETILSLGLNDSSGQEALIPIMKGEGARRIESPTPPTLRGWAEAILSPHRRRSAGETALSPIMKREGTGKIGGRNTHLPRPYPGDAILLSASTSTRVARQSSSL